MQTFKKIIPFLLAIVLFTSCHKEKIESNLPEAELPMPVLKGKKLVFSNMFKDYDAKFIYNADSTIQQMILLPHGYTDEYSTYSYAGNTVTEVMARNGIKNSEKGITVKNGRTATAYSKYFNVQGAVVQESHMEYKYDAKGLLHEIVYNGGLRAVYTHDAAGDLIKREYFYNGLLSSMVEYSYTNIPDKNPGFGFVWADGFGIYLPPMSAHLVKHIKGTDEIGVVTSEKNFDYELDADGYVKSGTTTDLLTSSQYHWVNNFE